MSATTSTAAADQAQTFQIRPPANEKLHSSAVKEVLHSVLVEQLSNFVYDAETSDKKVNCLAEVIRERLHELSVTRYKFVVNVVLGEQRGGGIKVGARCLWDTDTDTAVSDTFLTETFFCSAAVFGAFFY
uniref:Tctex1 domain-containing protein 2-like n=1 Tax=Hirondellea gigas TaxID=1518452 RepID=A0A2P2I766_9CRUS